MKEQFKRFLIFLGKLLWKLIVFLSKLLWKLFLLALWACLRAIEFLAHTLGEWVKSLIDPRNLKRTP